MEKKVFQKPKYLKDAVFHYCPGCGHSIIHRIVAEVIEELDIGEITIGVPPAGCAVLAYNYFDVDMAEAIVRFQQMQTALQANLATASKVLNLSLLDYLS